MAANVVCEGATCSCNQGSATGSLIVTSQTITKINNLLVATVKDFAPTTNVPPMGNCTILTSAAQGATTPCVPVTPAVWSPGAGISKINNLAVLPSDSTLTCTVGGSVSISSPNCNIEVSTK